MYPKLKARIEWVLSLLLLLPAIGIIMPVAAAIYIADSYDPFFTQIRVGKNGKHYRIYKMRTMWQFWESDPNTRDIGNGHQLKDDDRLIHLKIGKWSLPIGYWIRKWSLDEVPQVINVFFGQMSFVGPRPAQQHEIDMWKKDYPEEVAARLSVKPGVTGLAQVNGRALLELAQKLAYDMQYAKSFSFISDLNIWMKTFKVVLSGRGAY